MAEAGFVLMARRLYLTFSATAVLALACNKPPPDEHVYTGAPLGGLDASLPSLDATTLPPSDATTSFDAMPPPQSEELAAAVLAECGPPPSPQTTFSKPSLLASAAVCARRSYCEFDVYRRDLTEKVSAYVASPSDTTRNAARDAWKLANARWQHSELYRFGPAAPQMEPGGRNLRAQIYAFPVFDRCLVDEQTVKQTYLEGDFGTNSFASGRGLAALEYLLFYEGLDNGCSSLSLINSNGSWQALSADELAARRRAYAERAARELEPPTRALREAWDPAKGDFTRTFSQPGASNPVYRTEQAALNALGFALYYVEQEVKDIKLGLLLPNISLDCTRPDGCPERVESPHALVSTDNIRQNLRAFREIFEGCGENNQGLGFDDALRALGPAGDDLATRMLNALSASERAVDELNPPLELAARQNPDRVLAVYRTLKTLTDLIKTEFLSLLDIEPPMSAEGDND